jgi:hypothetical protein
MSIGMLSRMVPEITAVSLPFVSDNYDQARRAIAGPVGTLISKKLEAKGFIVLAWMDLGALQVSNSTRPLRTLADFRDLRIRVLPIGTHMAVFKAIGVRPIAMELTDVAAALRQGDVDGLELDYFAIYANKYYESQRYISDTGISWIFTSSLPTKACLRASIPAAKGRPGSRRDRGGATAYDINRRSGCRPGVAEGKAHGIRSVACRDTSGAAAGDGQRDR